MVSPKTAVCLEIWNIHPAACAGSMVEDTLIGAAIGAAAGCYGLAFHAMMELMPDEDT